MSPADDQAFQRALEEVLRHEGGYVNDPNDPGGETAWGISKRAYPELDIVNLTRDRAAQIYHEDYWLAAGCELLPPPVALAVFDSAVNQGVRAAVRMLQQELGVLQDGIVGQMTAAKAWESDPLHLLGSFMARRVIRYANLSHFERYGLGWMRRCFAVHQAAMRLHA